MIVQWMFSFSARLSDPHQWIGWREHWQEPPYFLGKKKTWFPHWFLYILPDSPLNPSLESQSIRVFCQVFAFMSFAMEAPASAGPREVAALMAWQVFALIPRRIGSLQLWKAAAPDSRYLQILQLRKCLTVILQLIQLILWKANIHIHVEAQLVGLNHLTQDCDVSMHLPKHSQRDGNGWVGAGDVWRTATKLQYGGFLKIPTIGVPPNHPF